jgi:hypothetical protein
MHGPILPCQKVEKENTPSTERRAAAFALNHQAINLDRPMA